MKTMSFDHLTCSTRFLQLGDDFYSAVTASPLKQPYWVHINHQLAKVIGLNESSWQQQSSLDIFSGRTPFPKQPSVAMVYAGHQFGGYSPQLGDGRALLIAQIDTTDGTVDLQLKGAGKTPYSRFGDGRAVLRSSIREYLGGEAMHHLGIATTRALCIVGSEEPVLREQMETGAIVTRVAKTHIRFGHFEYFHYNKQFEQVKQLADYVIEQFLPAAVNSTDKYEQLLQYTVSNTAVLIAHWQSVGFAHGVMNTDNMSIIGETLDYGPYGFLDDYEPGFICNHSDHTGRYAFDEQPSIGLWNLNALAHALSSLIDTASIQQILKGYETILVSTFAQLMRNKLGLENTETSDQILCSSLLSLMAQDKVDYTLFFRKLCEFKTQGEENNPILTELFSQKEKFKDWCDQYCARLKQEQSNDAERQSRMKKVNPKYIARNYLLQRAIEKAQREKDFEEINILFNLLQSPFDEHYDYEEYANPPPTWGKHLEISCSS
ncbi:MAG: protein adenylyltransferase SelO [Cellvibrionaceae bacterium]